MGKRLKKIGVSIVLGFLCLPTILACWLMYIQFGFPGVFSVLTFLLLSLAWEWKKWKDEQKEKIPYSSSDLGEGEPILV